MLVTLPQVDIEHTHEFGYVNFQSNGFEQFGSIWTIPCSHFKCSRWKPSVLVDSGATTSVIKFSALYQQPLRQQYMVSLTCVTTEGTVLKHSLLFLDVCPVTLLGRDFMCRLGILLISTLDGMNVQYSLQTLTLTLTLDSGGQFLFTGVSFSSEPLQYKYHWLIRDMPVTASVLESACFHRTTHFLCRAVLCCTCFFRSWWWLWETHFYYSVQGRKQISAYYFID